MRSMSAALVAVSVVGGSIPAAAGTIEPVYIGRLHAGNAVRFCELVATDDATRGRFSLDLTPGTIDGTSLARSFDTGSKTLTIWIEAPESWQNCDVTVSGIELGRDYLEDGMSARLDVAFARKSYHMVKGMQSFGYAKSKAAPKSPVAVKLP